MPIPRHDLAVARNTFNTADQNRTAVEQRAEAKRAEITKLETERDELALAVVLDEDGAKDAYDSLQAQVDHALTELKLLETAGAEAQRRADKAARPRRSN